MPNSNKILILGLGVSGLAAADLACKQRAAVTVLDTEENDTLNEHSELLQAKGASVTTGWNHNAPDQEFDLAVISPGISSDSQLGRLASELSCPVISELEFASRYCKCPILAVTGTNGKTTTVELTTHCLKAAGINALAAGNIGHALSEAVQKSSKFDVFVVEASSFQLERLQTFKPLAAALLNLTPDHLNRYASEQEYYETKLNIFASVSSGKNIILNADIAQLDFVKQSLGTRDPVSFSSKSHADFFLSDDGMLCCREDSGTCLPFLKQSDTRLRGKHNAENMLAATALCHCFGIAPEKIVKGMKTYTPSPHRLELVTVNQGVTYINDSKSTNPDSMMRAIEAVACECPGQILLVAGGLDKELEFSAVKPLLKQYVKGVYLLGGSRENLARLWSDTVVCKTFASMEALVDEAVGDSEHGDIVLLSPGCASQDMYKSYAERGTLFCELVTRRTGE